MRLIVLERHEAPVVAFNIVRQCRRSGRSCRSEQHGSHVRAHDRERHHHRRNQQLAGRAEGARTRRKCTTGSRRSGEKGSRADKAKFKQLEAEFKDAVESANGYVEQNAYPRVIEEQGGVGFNAGTAQDYTTYFYSLPANKMELWFLFSSEWFKRPVFREFYKERDVVREERRMRVESSTQGKLIELLMATAFMAHPYRNMIGWASEIEALRAKHAEEFFQKYYAPGNITVAVVGDVNPAEITQMAEKYFGTIPARALASAGFSCRAETGRRKTRGSGNRQPAVSVDGL